MQNSAKPPAILASANLIRGLLPPCVAVAESVVEGGAWTLWPEEEALVTRAVRKRRQEFAAGRTLARRALAELGAAAGPILRTDRGAPAWPGDCIGSITHAGGLAAVAAARLSDLAGLGIDIEGWRRFHPGLERRILTPRETGTLEALASDERMIAVAIRFSAKESFYKLQHPLTSLWLGFHDAEIEVDPETAMLRVITDPESPAAAIARTTHGRYRLADGLAATAMWVESHPEAPPAGGRSDRSS